jgi:hypothetical protein
MSETWKIDPTNHLEEAHWHFAAGVRRVADQRATRERLRFAGGPMRAADEFLHVLEHTLRIMLSHRQMLEREMAEWRKTKRTPATEAHARYRR